MTYDVDLDKLFQDNPDLAKANDGGSLKKNTGTRAGVTGSQPVPRAKESEDDFLSWVIDAAHLNGWKIEHKRPAFTSKGYRTAIQGDDGGPDAVMARGGRFILAELKTDTGRLSPEQKEWHKEGVVTWRPSMRQEILEILK